MNGNKRIQKKRAFLLTENEEPIFRYAININGRNFIEYDLFNALVDMDKAGIVELRKIFSMLKSKYGITLTDAVDSVMRYSEIKKEEIQETKFNDIVVIAKGKSEDIEV